MMPRPSARRRPAGRFAVRLAFVSVLVLFALAVSLRAGEAPAAEPAATPAGQETSAIRRDTVEALVKEIKAAADLDDETRRKLLETADAALKQLAAAGMWKTRADSVAKDLGTAPEKTREIRAQLEKPLEEPVVEVPAGASVAAIEEQHLNPALSQQQDARKRAQEAEAELQSLAKRRPEVPKLLEAARARIEVAEERLKEPPPAEGPALAERVDRTLARAQEAAAQAEVAALEKETAQWFDVRADLLNARRDIAQRQALAAEKRIAKLREIVAERRRKEAQAAAEEARRAREQLASVHPLIEALAATNAELADQRTGPQGLSARIEKATERARSSTETLEALTAEFRSVEQKVAAAGDSRTIGQYLRKKRADMPDPREYRRALKARAADISSVQLELIGLEERRTGLTDLDRRVEEAMAGLGPEIAGEKREEIRKAARRVLLDRRELLDSLIDDYNTLYGTLVDLSATEAQLIARADEFARFVDERVLWIRSTRPFGFRTVHRTAEAALWLANPLAWNLVFQTLLRDVLAAPALYVLALIVLAPLLVLRRRIRRKLDQQADLVRKVQTDRLGYTFLSMLLTPVLAALWPAVWLFAFWRLSAGATSEFPAAVAAGGLSAGVVFLVLSVVAGATRPKGLCEAHFRWRAEALSTVRRHLIWLLPVLLAATFVVTLFQYQRNEAWVDSLGRIAFIVGMVALAVFLYRILHPRGAVMRETLTRKSGGWLDRLRVVWFPLAVGLPVALALVTALGYYYTARQLEGRLYLTLLLIVALLVLDALVGRCLLVARQRMALRKAEERKKAREREREEHARAEQEGAPAPEVQPEPEDLEPSILSISKQSSKLLRSVILVALVVGLWAIWSDVLPALGILKRIELWSTTAKQAETVTAPDGSTSVRTVEKVVPVTVASVALALIIVALTIVATRNVPGLLEITLLQRLPLEHGVRFAITAVTRYVMTIVGFVFAFAAIGIGWQKVQWLAAAVTVGLGFGLQEIFANFVSGLIILFEQPMRVGDTVTVGDISGTVTKIRIRATTITDWDRKELVVPNKEFITGRLINWSLSDTVLRIVIPVGIAYGSDTALAEKILYEVAEAAPNVLDEPRPTVLFKDFGASSLDFDLRVYIPSIDYYIPTIHALHRAIDDAFRKADIEIAFPQRDIHIRSVEVPFPIAQSRFGAPSVEPEPVAKGQGGATQRHLAPQPETPERDDDADDETDVDGPEAPPVT
jgi:potassium efflux system protein